MNFATRGGWSDSHARNRTELLALMMHRAAALDDPDVPMYPTLKESYVQSTALHTDLEFMCDELDLLAYTQRHA